MSTENTPGLPGAAPTGDATKPADGQKPQMDETWLLQKMNDVFTKRMAKVEESLRAGLLTEVRTALDSGLKPLQDGIAQLTTASTAKDKVISEKDREKLEYENRLKQLETKNQEAELRIKQQEQDRENAERRSAIQAAYLASRGKPDSAKIAVQYLDGQIKGTSREGYYMELPMVDNDPASIGRYSLKDGVSKWLELPEGKSLREPTGAGGAGVLPGQAGAPSQELGGKMSGRDMMYAALHGGTAPVK